MLSLAQLDDGIVEIRASGTLSAEDYDAFTPKLEEIARASGPVRLLVKLEDFRGWTPPALWKDLAFDATHQHDMDRIAVVGERTWQEWGTILSKPFFKAEVHWFDPSAEAEAHAWLKRD